MMLCKGILESLMLILGDSNIGVIWYLTAMIWIFPLYCFALQKVDDKVLLLLSKLYVLFFMYLLENFLFSSLIIS